MLEECVQLVTVSPIISSEWFNLWVKPRANIKEKNSAVKRTSHQHIITLLRFLYLYLNSYIQFLPANTFSLVMLLQGFTAVAFSSCWFKSFEHFAFSGYLQVR